ncbi:MAG: hypothetical protein ACRD0K_31090, partial [Egibacteraceae bacterium]
MGLSASDARAAGMTVRTATISLAASGRAATIAADQGFVRLVIDADADAIVGAQIAAPYASELIAHAALAIEMAASPLDLAATIHPTPPSASCSPPASPSCCSCSRCWENYRLYPASLQLDTEGLCAGSRRYSA